MEAALWGVGLGAVVRHVRDWALACAGHLHLPVLHGHHAFTGGRSDDTRWHATERHRLEPVLALNVLWLPDHSLWWWTLVLRHALILLIPTWRLSGHGWRRGVVFLDCNDLGS